MKKKILSLVSGAMITCFAVNSNAQNVWQDATNGASITTGTDNAAFGYYSQNKNKTGNRNTSIGYKALFWDSSGSYNTALGANSLFYSTTGSNNTATGFYSLFYSTIATNNTANGYNSMYFHKKGNENSAFGANSLFQDTISSYNTASGFSALYNNRAASYNTATGWKSMYSNRTGTRNTALGYNSLYNSFTGAYNTAIGGDALYTNTSGSKNTALGFYADVSTYDLENATAIGYYATATADNQIMLGNSAVTAVKTYGDVIWTSDSRFKKNIKENVPGLDFIKQLRPVTYNFDIHKLDAHIKGSQQKEISDNELLPDALQKDEQAISKKEKKLYSGFLAQEVEAVANKLGYDFNGVYHPQNDKDVYGLGYSDFVVPLVKAVQELAKQNADLQNQINELKNSTVVNSENNLSSTKAMLTSATLEQNIPNPLKSNTSLGYKLPEVFKTAQIVITDFSGKTIKQLTLKTPGSGSLNIDGSLLSNGVYNYSLVIDGKIIDSKKMMVAK